MGDAITKWLSRSDNVLKDDWDNKTRRTVRRGGSLGWSTRSNQTMSTYSLHPLLPKMDDPGMPTIEDRSVWGPMDGHSWLWWVIDNVVWTDSWTSIAGAGCRLICVGAGEEWTRKVYALRGLRGVERKVGLTRGTRWPAGSSAGRMVARKARQSRRSESVQGSDSRPESARGLCGSLAQNRRVTWLSHKTKTGGSMRGEGSGRS
jgi:hypothetical protein